MRLKKILLIACICCTLKASGQDMIYLVDGTSALGKVETITNDSITLRDLIGYAGRVHSFSIAKVRIAFNLSGNYLVFNQAQSFSDSEKSKLIQQKNKFPSATIVVDLKGKLFELSGASESATTIKASGNVKLIKDDLAFIIRKNGTHELFCPVGVAVPYLIKYQTKIDSLITATPIPSWSAPKLEPNYFDDNYIPPDMALVEKEAFRKMKTLSQCLRDIISKRIGKEEAYKVITTTNRHGIFFFHDRDSRIEILNSKTGEKRILKLSDFLDELVKKGDQLDGVDLTYIAIDYSSEFKKSTDGNYYGIVTFMQRAQGFSEKNVIYGAQTKQNVTFVLPALSGPNVEELLGWEVYLDQIGVIEFYK